MFQGLGLTRLHIRDQSFRVVTNRKHINTFEVHLELSDQAY